MVLAGIGLVRATTRRESTHDVNRNMNGRTTAARTPLPPPPVALDATDPAEAPVPPDSMPSADAVPRIARTWTKVHDRRSVKADLVAVLLPGDTVLVDSLRGRWWRVALEGRVIGYVYAGTLVGN
jgi:hypothetical protein